MNFNPTKTNTRIPVIQADKIRWMEETKSFICEDSDLRANDIQSCWNSKTGEINPPSKYRIVNPITGIAYNFTFKEVKFYGEELAAWEYEATRKDGMKMNLTIFND